MRIVLIEQQPLFREGFTAVVNRCEGFRVVGSAGHARRAFELVDELMPDVVAINLALPGMSGYAATREVRRRRPEARVLAISDSCVERDVLEAFSAGALGFVAKTDPGEAVVEALRALGRSERFLGPAARMLALPTAVRPEMPDTDVLGVLSSREREVFDLVVRGFKNRDVARELCISVKTVETHRLHINRKLACSSSLDLVRFALGNGILSWRIDEAADVAPVAEAAVTLS